VEVTPAVVENNPVIRLVSAMVSSVSVSRLDLRQGQRGWGGLGRRGIAPSPPRARLQRHVRSRREMPAGGCLRTEGVRGAGLRWGLRFAPAPHRKGHSQGRYPQGRGMFSGKAQALPDSAGMSRC